MEDAEIVDLYWQRSEQAIEETERKYGAYCRHIARSVCNDREDAEECVNDTWLGAWNAMPDKRPSRLSTFLGRICRNLAIHVVERRGRLKRGGGELPLALEELGECLADTQDVERDYELREFRQAIGDFVAGLSRPERQVFVARYWYLAPVAEIAERMHFSQSKVKSMLYRLRERLGRYLKEEGLW